MGKLKKYGELDRKEKNGKTEKVWRAKKKGEEWALHTFSVVPFLSFLPSSPYFFSCPILLLST
jgi:hypothetical protein